jgi:uncharacterized membrane protein YgcG
MKKLLLILVAAFVAVLIGAPKVHADVNDFVINKFHGRYELFNDEGGGRMVVNESIELTFSDQNHGILRAIPKSYKDSSLRLKVLEVKRDGEKEPYSKYSQGGNTVLKIGDPDKTITGDHIYEITYEMGNVISFYDSYDEWYWDINGTQWQQRFQNVSGEVIFPEGWKTEGIPSASCYTGKQNDTESVCTIRRNSRGYTFTSDMPLEANETLTIAATSEKWLFHPNGAIDWWRDNAWQVTGVLVGLMASTWSFLMWWKHGKDFKGKGVVYPEYKPPKDLSPAEVGLLWDYGVDSHDLTATIIDLAVRGYIKIHDDEKKTLKIFKSHEFSLELTNAKFGDLKPYEKDLLTTLFKPAKTGTIQKLADIDKTAMYKTVTSIRSKLKKSLVTDHGLIDNTPAHVNLKLWGAGILLFLILIFLRPGWGWYVGIALAFASIAFSLMFMRRRTHAGEEALERLKGLQMYMTTAEKDRYDMMYSVDRPYSEPARSPALFEKLLPFAVALGVEKSWAKQFDHIYTQQPDWYSGNYAAFNAAYFASNLGSSMSAFNSTFTQSTSSSSSGSGGGGFSGGGGGGGGGGGW